MIVIRKGEEQEKENLKVSAANKEVNFSVLSSL